MYRYKDEAEFIDFNLSKCELDRFLKLDLLTEDDVMSYEGRIQNKSLII